MIARIWWTWRLMRITKWRGRRDGAGWLRLLRECWEDARGY